MVIVPLGVFALADWSRADLARFAFLSTLGTYSLLPLLHRPEEYAIKARGTEQGPRIEAGSNGLAGDWARAGRALAPSPGSHPAACHPPTRRGNCLPCRACLGAKPPVGIDPGDLPPPLPLQVLLLALYTWIALGLLRGDPGDQGSLLTLRQRCYLWGLVPLEVLGSLVLPSMPKVMSRLPFLSLALVSSYCALGVGAALVDMARAYVPSGKDKGE